MTTTRRAALAMAAAAAIPVSSARADLADSPLLALGRELEAAMASDWKAWDWSGELSDRLDEWRWQAEGPLAVRPEDVALGVPGAARAMEDKAAGRRGCFGKWDVAAMRVEQFTETIVDPADPAVPPALYEITPIRMVDASIPGLSGRCAEIVAAWDAREAEIKASGLPNRVEEALAAARAATEVVHGLIERVADCRARSVAEFEVKRRALIYAIEGVAGAELTANNLRGDPGEPASSIIMSMIEDARAALAGG